MATKAAKFPPAPLINQFDDEVEEVRPVTDDGALRTVSMYAEELASIEIEILSLTEQLDKLSKTKRELSEDKLPTAMHLANLSSFKTVRGLIVEVKKFTAARISATNKSAAMQWLRDHGHGGLIRSEISVEFPKGKETLAAEAESALNSLGCTVIREDNVHFKTLEKFVKEMHEDGKEVPTDLFGVFVGRRATIKQSPTLS